jgi:hypothetical protein
MLDHPQIWGEFQIMARTSKKKTGKDESEKVLQGHDQDLDRCGFVNRHWLGEEIMVCVLPKGHAGNHQAPYKRPPQAGSNVLEDALASYGNDAGVAITGE